MRASGAGTAAPPSSFSTPTASSTPKSTWTPTGRLGRGVRRVGKRAIPQLVIDGEWFQPYKPGRGLLYDELHQRLGIPRA